MNDRPLGFHVLLSLGLLLASFLGFTFLQPGIFPHPEDFGPWAYLIALVSLVLAFALTPRGRKRWVYGLIIAFCTLAFLDEIGYGVELFGWKSLYIEQFHIEIHDLHNLIGLLAEVIGDQLAVWKWNYRLFLGYLLFDVGLLLAGFGVAWLLRYRMHGESEKPWRMATLALAYRGAIIIGLIAAGFLLSLPADQSSAFVFGYSGLRIGVAVFILACSILPFLVRKRLGSSIDWVPRSKLANLVLPGLFLLALLYQGYTTFVYLPDEIVRFQRITPIVLWAQTEVALFWLALRMWQGEFRTSITDQAKRTMGWLVQEPAFFYCGFAVLLILIAQLIDQSIIPLNEMIVTPNFHIKLWGLWVEEIFETTAAFFFVVAAFFFPRRKKH